MRRQPTILELLYELVERFLRWRAETREQRIARRFDEQERAYWRAIQIDQLKGNDDEQG